MDYNLVGNVRKDWLHKYILPLRSGSLTAHCPTQSAQKKTRKPAKYHGTSTGLKKAFKLPPYPLFSFFLKKNKHWGFKQSSRK